jgi:hypothetical protein
MAKESVIHIRFENSEAIAAKRDILTTQLDLLKIAKTIKSYNFYRLKELELKMVLLKKIREVKKNTTKMHKILPTLRVPEILKKEQPKEKEDKYHEEKRKKSYDRSLEDQLQEIQRRLNRLQR